MSLILFLPLAIEYTFIGTRMKPPMMMVKTAAMLSGIALAVKVLPVFFFNAWNAICCSLILRPETWALAV